jgi:hypothetical protein
MILISILVCLTVAVLLLLPPGGGKTKQFTDKNGNILPRSISP